MSELIPFNQRARTPDASAGGAGYDAVPEEALDLKELFRVMRRHAWLVLGVTATIVAATAVVVLRQPPMYKATASFRLKDERRAMARGIEDAALEQVMGKASDPLFSQLQVLRSRSIGDAVIQQAGLRAQSLTDGFSATLLADLWVAPELEADTITFHFDESEFTVRTSEGVHTAAYRQPLHTASLGFVIAGPPPLAEARVSIVTEDRAFRDLQDMLTARAREKTDFIEVEVTSADPRLAQRVVNSMVEVFRDANLRAAREQSRKRRLFVEEQLAQTDSMLMAAQLELSEFRRQQQVFSSREKFAAQQTGLFGLEVRRGELDADRRMYDSMLRGLQRPRDGASRSSILRTAVSSPGVAANPVIAGLYAQLVQFETARDSLTTGIWGSSTANPDVLRLDELIAGTEAKLVDAMRSHIAAVEARIAALDDLRDRNARAIENLPDIEASETRLVQQVDIVRQMADQLRSEFQKARIEEAIEAGQVEVVDYARLPSEPVGSGRSLKLALGLMLGLLLGGGSAFLIEHLNSSIRRREDLERMLRVPGLAIIPQIAAHGSNRTGIARMLPVLSRSGNGGPPARANGRPVSVEQHLDTLVTVSDLRSGGAEAYRTLRTNLIFSQAATALRRIVVTSSSPGEGKTTTAANLAVTYAQQGMRVLLVDCDLRRPRLHTLFRLAKEPGLTQLVIGHNDRSEVVRETLVEGLHVLPCGTLPPNPSELLGGVLMQEVLEALSAEFDLVVLDTPPLLAAADAAILGSRSDGVLVVIRAGQTDRDAAQQALQQLYTVGARVLGAVLNDPDAKLPRYGGYHYSYDYYGGE